MIIGICVVVDELHKGPRLIFRYPETIPDICRNHRLRLIFEQFYTVSQDSFAKLLRPKTSIVGKILEITIGDIYYISLPSLLQSNDISKTTQHTSLEESTTSLFNIIIARISHKSMKKVDPKYYYRCQIKSLFNPGLNPMANAVGIVPIEHGICKQTLKRAIEGLIQNLMQQEKKSHYFSKQVSILIGLIESVNNARREELNSLHEADFLDQEYNVDLLKIKLESVDLSNPVGSSITTTTQSVHSNGSDPLSAHGVQESELPSNESKTAEGIVEDGTDTVGSTSQHTNEPGFNLTTLRIPSGSNHLPGETTSNINPTLEPPDEAKNIWNQNCLQLALKESTLAQELKLLFHQIQGFIDELTFAPNSIQAQLAATPNTLKTSKSELDPQKGGSGHIYKYKGINLNTQTLLTLSSTDAILNMLNELDHLHHRNGGNHTSHMMTKDTKAIERESMERDPLDKAIPTFQDDLKQNRRKHFGNSRLHNLLQAADPTLSLIDLSLLLDEPHEESWGLAEIIPLLYSKSCYKVNQHVSIGWNSSTVRAFENFLIGLNLSPRTSGTMGGGDTNHGGNSGLETSPSHTHMGGGGTKPSAMRHKRMWMNNGNLLVGTHTTMSKGNESKSKEFIDSTSSSAKGTMNRNISPNQGFGDKTTASVTFQMDRHHLVLPTTPSRAGRTTRISPPKFEKRTSSPGFSVGRSTRVSPPKFEKRTSSPGYGVVYQHRRSSPRRLIPPPTLPATMVSSSMEEDIVDRAQPTTTTPSTAQSHHRSGSTQIHPKVSNRSPDRSSSGKTHSTVGSYPSSNTMHSIYPIETIKTSIFSTNFPSLQEIYIINYATGTFDRMTHSAQDSLRTESVAKFDEYTSESSNLISLEDSIISVSFQKEYNLMHILSLFDGNRIFEEVIKLMPAGLKDHAVDVMVFLLRWHVVVGVHSYVLNTSLLPSAILSNTKPSEVVEGSNSSSNLPIQPLLDDFRVGSGINLDCLDSSTSNTTDMTTSISLASVINPDLLSSNSQSATASSYLKSSGSSSISQVHQELLQLRQLTHPERMTYDKMLPYLNSHVLSVRTVEEIIWLARIKEEDFMNIIEKLPYLYIVKK